MERPALRQLLDDVRAERVDLVVVYKVDRLTRSLTDFVKLTELFDAHNVSFVSVTQAFNTSTSMGRLTLNVLLSFAQFEREVAGERIRDKIALSKQRGMWMGGQPPLGYDGIDRKLVVNDQEAETVRLIFQRYLEVGSIAALKQSLDDQGIRSKRRCYKNGKEVGGAPISRGALYQILRNRIYRGEIAHRGNVYPGNHDAIVDAEIWDRVQEQLQNRSGKKRGRRPSKSEPSLLNGLVFDEHGHRLTLSHANKKGKRYRYYVSAPLVRGDRDAKGIRVPAPDLEDLIIQTIADQLADAAWITQKFGSGLDADHIECLVDVTQSLSSKISNADRHGSRPDSPTVTDLLHGLIDTIVVGKRLIELWLDHSGIARAIVAIDQKLTLETDTNEPINIAIDARHMRCGKQVKLIVGEIETERLKPNRDLIALIVDAHRWFEDLKSGRRKTIAEIAKLEKHPLTHVSRSISLAFLAPDIAEIILAGRQPATLTPEHLKACRPLPLEWQEQRDLLLG